MRERDEEREGGGGTKETCLNVRVGLGVHVLSVVLCLSMMIVIETGGLNYLLS